MSSDLPKSTFRLRPNDQRVILIIGDLLMGILAILGGVYFWSAGDKWINFSIDFFKVRVPFWFYLLPLAWMLLLMDLYDVHRAASWQRTTRAVTVAGLVSGFAYLLIYFASPDPGQINRRGVGGFLILVILLTLLWRRIYIRIYQSQRFGRRVVIAGAGVNGLSLAQIYKTLSPPPFTLVGFIDDDPQKHGKEYEGYPVLGCSAQLLALVDRFNISDVVVAISGEMLGSTFQTLLDAQEKGIEIARMQTIYEELLGRVPIHHLESDWVLRSFVDETRSDGLYEFGKRILDIFGSIIGLMIFMVLLPFVSLAILIESGLPILYWQERLGKGGKEFKIVKFRTMIRDAEKDGRAQMAGEKDPRITRVGNFLRATRLDEFPQFWNVLRGEMSLVGPRAERAQWVATFQQEIPFYRARLLVKPGISGWAQVNYGYAANVEDTSIKLEYDLYYIKHRSVMMDIAIILRTISTVFGRKGR
jgi:exopolysaccharide biosynthesis polyprenyl glycosylphosphotransferase